MSPPTGTLSRRFDAHGRRGGVGDLSYDQSAPARYQRRVPDAKLIAILRDPVDRAFSSYMHLVRDGRDR